MKLLGFLVFTASVLAVKTKEDQNSQNQPVSQQFSTNINQRPLASRPQSQSHLNSGLGQSDSSRSSRTLNGNSDDKLFSADSSYGLGQQNIQPIQGRFWTSSGNNWNGGGNNGFGWNNNNYGNNGYWNTNNYKGWNQGSIGGGQKPGSCGRPVPYNSFNQNLNSGSYFDRSDEETKNTPVIDARVEGRSSNGDSNDVGRKKHSLRKREYTAGLTPYYNQGGSFGAGVGYSSGYSLPGGGGYNYNRYNNNNYYSGGVSGINSGYYGGGQGGNGIGAGWSSSGRNCFRDFECPGNLKCCGRICTNPVYYG